MEEVKMYSIDKIMQMLDSSYEKNNSEEVQNKGIELGKKVKFFDIFFNQSIHQGKWYGKIVQR